MIEWTSLPNLHPAAVHFPIALLPAALLFEIAAWIRSRDGGLVRAAVIQHLLAGLAAAAAYLTGRQAEDSLVGVPASAQSAIAAHSDAALVALIAISSVAVVRLLLAWRDHRVLGRPSALGRSVGVVGGVVALALLVLAADRGIKGLVDGATVVHGHGEPGPGRSVALRFEGHGRVELVDVRVERLDQAP